MSEFADDLLLYGISAAKANSREEARNYLEWVLRTDADFEQQADAWYWLSTITDDAAEKRSCLENVLAIAPTYPEARRDLAIVDGRLRPGDVIDPRFDVQPIVPDSDLEQADVQAYKCPRCGAKLSADRGTGALVCGFCGYRPVDGGSPSAQQPIGVQEQDWVSAVYAAKGHRWEVPTARTYGCESCGAKVLVPAGQVSTNCPFCGTPHVIQSEDELELIEPAGLLPFAIQAASALKAVTDWLRKQHFAPAQLGNLAVQSAPHPVYLPFWTFDMEGNIRWSASEVKSELGRPKMVRTSGSIPMLVNDVLVPGSKSLPAEALTKIKFNLEKLVPFTPSLLASWPAEIYSISPVDASMDARERALEDIRNNGSARDNVSAFLEDFEIEGADITILSYKLVLLPVWVGSYSFEGQTYPVVVDGFSGQVQGELPRNILQKVLNRLLG